MIDIMINVYYSQNQKDIHTKGGEQMQAYCVKDKKMVEIKDPKAITMKNGRPATQGTCPICGTKVFRIGKS
jgi:hypothetical protein